MNGSIEAQLDMARDHVASHGYLLVEEITESGFSGNNLQRPGLEHLQSLIEQQQIDVVIVANLDRLTRRLAVLLQLLQQWSQAGVRVESCDNEVML